MCTKSLQSRLTLCDPMDCSPPGSSVHGILQARILEWVAMPFSRKSSQPQDQTPGPLGSLQLGRELFKLICQGGCTKSCHYSSLTVHQYSIMGKKIIKNNYQVYRTLEFSWPFHFHTVIYFPQLSRWLRQGLLFHFKMRKLRPRVTSLEVAELRPESTFPCLLPFLYSIFINCDNIMYSVK